MGSTGFQFISTSNSLKRFLFLETLLDVLEIDGVLAGGSNGDSRFAVRTFYLPRNELSEEQGIVFWRQTPQLFLAQ
jgi:hypothetical protein